MERYNNYKEQVNCALSELDLDRAPPRLYRPISYTLSLGGKRLRPILTLAACDLFGGNPDQALHAAIGLEIFHNFTLLHDDIMDEAPLRRGEATVYKKWNPNVAILSGDTMFALATNIINKTQHPSIKDILELFTQTAIEVCEGQQLDMDFESQAVVSIAEYLNMIRLKTAVLLGTSLQIGAIIGNANREQAQNIYDFGLNVGLAFQLKDDYLDAFGETEAFGKDIGGDIRANKKTYLYLKCLEQANEQDARKLLGLFETPTDNTNEKVKEVLSLYEKYNIKTLSLQEMEKYFGKAIEMMNHVGADREKKIALTSYAEWLYKRNH
ncbi:MAG: polyprenyl synthetase family protein [Bacteroidales bacterium]